MSLDKELSMGMNVLLLNIYNQLEISWRSRFCVSNKQIEQEYNLAQEIYLVALKIFIYQCFWWVLMFVFSFQSENVLATKNII